MSGFYYGDDGLRVEGVSLEAIASAAGTPCYVYSRAAIEQAWQSFDQALEGIAHRVCYAVKANPSLAIIDLLARLGSGFDVVSEGELRRVMAAGGDPARAVFSGVAKTEDEIRFAIGAGIFCFNVESGPELERVRAIARAMRRATHVAFRVNPDVDPKTHPYISTGLRENKFGIPIAEAWGLAQSLVGDPYVTLTGLACHIGSQITELSPVRDAIVRVLALWSGLAGAGQALRHLDIGGGLGVRYQHEQPPSIAEYVATVRAALRGAPALELVLEPGRAVVGEAGVLLTRVQYLKSGVDRRFAIVDAGMNDLLRPALYDAWHDIQPVQRREGVPEPYDVVGPVCESSDVLGRARFLVVAPGDVLAVMTAGAYGASMGSTYNSRRPAAEVLVSGDRFEIIRARADHDSLWALERRSAW